MTRNRTGWITKILKLSERHEIFFPRVFFVKYFKNDLRIDEIFVVLPLSVFRPFLVLSLGGIPSTSNSTTIQNTHPAQNRPIAESRERVNRFNPNFGYRLNSLRFKNQKLNFQKKVLTPTLSENMRKSRFVRVANSDNVEL